MSPDYFSEGSNYSHYIPSDYLELDEATALSLGMNPQKAPLLRTSPFDKDRNLRQIREKFLERQKEIQQQELFRRHTVVTLEQFYLWGKEKQYQFDPAFVDHIEKKLSLPNWEKMHHDKCEENDQLHAELANVKKDLEEMRSQQEMNSSISAESSYTTPYLSIMQKAIKELNISEENQPKVAEELVQYFITELEDIGENNPKNKAKLMSTFVRLPKSAAGGNSKTKKIKNPPN